MARKLILKVFLAQVVALTMLGGFQPEPAQAATKTYQTPTVFTLRGAWANSRVTVDDYRHTIQIKSWVMMMSGGPQQLRACVSLFSNNDQTWYDEPCKYGLAGNPYGGCEGPQCIFTDAAPIPSGWYKVTIAYGWQTMSGWYKGVNRIGWIWV